MTSKLTPAQQAYAEIVKAVNSRRACLRNGTSRKPANWHQALGRVEAWLQGHTAASLDSLRHFLSTHGTDLDRVITGNAAGDNRRDRIHKLVKR